MNPLSDVFARDLVKAFREADPTEFDTDWDSLSASEKAQGLIVSDKMLQKGWVKNVPEVQEGS